MRFKRKFKKKGDIVVYDLKGSNGKHYHFVVKVLEPQSPINNGIIIEDNNMWDKGYVSGWDWDNENFKLDKEYNITKLLKEVDEINEGSS